MIRKQPFGSTGHMSTVTLFGAAALGRVTQQEADHTLDLLLEYGVNHIDTAASYGDAELAHRSVDGEASQGLLPGDEDRRADLRGGEGSRSIVRWSGSRWTR